VSRAWRLPAQASFTVRASSTVGVPGLGAGGSLHGRRQSSKAMVEYVEAVKEELEPGGPGERRN